MSTDLGLPRRENYVECDSPLAPEILVRNDHQPTEAAYRTRNLRGQHRRFLERVTKMQQALLLQEVGVKDILQVRRVHQEGFFSQLVLVHLLLHLPKYTTGASGAAGDCTAVDARCLWSAGGSISCRGGPGRYDLLVFLGECGTAASESGG